MKTTVPYSFIQHLRSEEPTILGICPCCCHDITPDDITYLDGVTGEKEYTCPACEDTFDHAHLL